MPCVCVCIFMCVVCVVCVCVVCVSIGVWVGGCNEGSDNKNFVCESKRDIVERECLIFK